MKGAFYVVETDHNCISKHHSDGVDVRLLWEIQEKNSQSSPGNRINSAIETITLKFKELKGSNERSSGRNLQ